MRNVESPWTVYHTRFLVCARQLTEPLVFTDVLGREHSGQPGDYLVESSDGFRRIMPRVAFEDIYVPLHSSPTTPPVRVTPRGTTPVVAPVIPKGGVPGCKSNLAPHSPPQRLRPSA